MDLNDRISKYLAACPAAISGQEGHTQTFQIAKSLYNGFALDEAQTYYWLTIYNQKCQPPWEEKDLARKAKQAAIKTDYSLTRGHLLDPAKYQPKNGGGKAHDPKPKIDPSVAMAEYLQDFRCDESTLYDASPIKPSEDFTKDGVLVLTHIFQSGDRVNFVTKFSIFDKKDGTKKANPDGKGETVDRDDLLLRWMIDNMPQSEAGGWMRINPVNGDVDDAHVTRYRVALIEFDRIPLDLQLSFLARVPLPIIAILTSGGKSLHAWVDISAPDLEAYQAQALKLRAMLKPFGIDGQNKNPSRLSRLVGVRRTIGAEGDPRQRLLYLNPTPDGKAICP